MKLEARELMMRSILTFTVLVPLVAGCAVDAARQNPSTAEQRPASVQVQVASDFESPWAMTFLPDGRMSITEKSGILYVVSTDGQQRKRVDGIPVVSGEGQGVHGRRAAPSLRNEPLVYFSYSEAGQGGRESCSPRAPSRMANSPSCKGSRPCSGLALRGRRRPFFRPHRLLGAGAPVLSPAASVRTQHR